MLLRAKHAYWSLLRIADEPAPHFKRWFRTSPRAFIVRALGKNVDLDGIKIPMGRYCSFEMAQELVAGGYESPERSLLRDHLRDDDRVLELGTGIGVVSTICAQRLGSERVFTFEANPRLIPIARQTFRLNGVAPTLENCILATSDGHRKLYVSKHFSRSSTMRRASGVGEVLVPVRKLSDVIASIRPTFLIVDIEGSEVEIFESVELPGVVKVLIEFHPQIVGEEKIARLKKAFEAAGYRSTGQLCNDTRILYEREAH